MPGLAPARNGGSKQIFALCFTLLSQRTPDTGIRIPIRYATGETLALIGGSMKA